MPANSKLNSIEVLVSKTSIGTGIDTSEFAKNNDLANLSLMWYGQIRYW